MTATEAATTASMRARQAVADDLRAKILAHLKGCTQPVTAYEIARALGLQNGLYGTGANRVRKQLLAMECDGEVRRVEGQRAPGDVRPAIRWRVTTETAATAAGKD